MGVYSKSILFSHTEVTSVGTRACVSDASRKLTKVGFAKDADWLARLYELLSLSVLAALFVASQTLNVLVAYD